MAYGSSPGGIGAASDVSASRARNVAYTAGGSARLLLIGPNGSTDLTMGPSATPALVSLTVTGYPITVPAGWTYKVSAGSAATYWWETP